MAPILTADPAQRGRFATAVGIQPDVYLNRASCAKWYGCQLAESLWMSARLETLATDVSTTDPIDWAYLDHATMGDRKLAREVLGLFVDQADGFAAEMRKMSPETCVHRLKGAARAIGAWPIARAAQAVEREIAARSALDASMALLMQQIATTRAAIMEHLRTHIGDAGAAHVDSL